MRHEGKFFTLREVIYVVADLQRELDDTVKERDEYRDSSSSANTRAHRVEGMLEQVEEERDGLLREKSALTGRVVELQDGLKAVRALNAAKRRKR